MSLSLYSAHLCVVLKDKRAILAHKAENPPTHPPIKKPIIAKIITDNLVSLHDPQNLLPVGATSLSLMRMLSPLLQVHLNIQYVKRLVDNVHLEVIPNLVENNVFSMANRSAFSETTLSIN